MFGMQKWLIIGLVVATALAGAYGVISYQLKKIDDLIAANAVLEETARINAAAVGRMIEQARIQQELNEQLSEEMLVSEQKREEVMQVFRDHKLSNLAVKKPEWIQRIINNGTREIFDNFESITAP